MVFAESSGGGSFIVTPGMGIVVFLMAALAFVVWFVAYLLRTPPRFLRLAFGFCNVGIGIALLSVMFLAVTTVVGSDSTTVGSPVAVGRGGVDVVAPINTNFSRQDDPTHERSVIDAYGAGARIYDATEVSVALDEPSAGVWVLSIGAVLARAGFVVAWLLILRGILDRASLGRPFDDDNARGLRRLALVTVGGGLLVPVANRIAMTAVVHEAGGSESIGWGLSVFTPVAVGVLLLALAEVWRYGIELQSDAEATV